MSKTFNLEEYDTIVVNDLSLNGSFLTNFQVGVPIGTILPWQDINTIPDGWKLCDGNGTYTDISGITRQIPDLRSKFIIGHDTRDTSFNIDTSGSSFIHEDTDLNTNNPRSQFSLNDTNQDPTNDTSFRRIFYSLAYIIRVSNPNISTDTAGDKIINGDLTATGNLFANGNLISTGNLTANGNLFANGDLSANGNLTANGNLYVTNNLGIGTTNPSDKLTINNGNLTITNGSLKAGLADNYAWNNYGQIISGVYESDNSVGLGVRVDMDASGLTMVAGAYAETTSELTGEGVAYVYKYDSNADIWYQHGSKIEFGAGCVGLSISSDGTIVAIAGYTGPAAGETLGRVRVYQYNSSSNTWQDYGTNQSIMEGQVSGERVGLRGFGASKDGNTVAFTERDGTNGVHVFRIVSGAWTKIGTFESSNYANSSLNYDGSRIVFIDITNQTGLVYDYSGSGTTWNQVGTTITHTGSNDPASYTAINKEGNVIALNEHTNQTVAIYSFDTASNDWVQKGQTFTDSEGSGGLFGQAPMRFSSDGNKIAITNNNNGSMYLYTYVHPFWEQSNQFVGTYTSTNFTISIGADDNITKIVGGGYAGDLNGTDSGYVQAWQWSQKTYTNPTLDVSGRTVSVWGNAEHSASNYTYSQLGSTLTGASNNTNLGTGMDMDSTGTIWAIADQYNTNVGSVHVYKYRNSAWSQMGSTIYGTYGEDFFGDDAHRLSLSGDGKVLVVGALASNLYTTGEPETRVRGYVNTYHYVNGDWVLFGETSGYNTSVSIVPTTNHTSSTLFGASVSTNNDGTVLAIGEYNNAGKGGIWRYNSSTDSWNNEFIFPYPTSGVGISKDGTRVVTGYEGSDINVINDGSLRVYNYNSSTQSWSQIGSTLTGYETQDRVGYRVAISGDGNTIVHCASNEDSSGNSFAQVYTYIQAANGGNGDWVQKGTDFVGTTAQRYGWACKLDYDGDTVILGSPYYDVCRIYKYINDRWEQIGPDFTFGTSSGSSTALSDDGMTFALGVANGVMGAAAAYILSKVEEPMLKIQDGNIGIGTTSPIPKIDVNGALFLRNETLTFSSGGGGGNATEEVALVFNQGVSDRTLALKTDTDANLYGTTGSGGGRSTKWCLGPSSNYYFLGSNVGINTTSPSYKLHVNGDVKVESNLYLKGSGGYINYAEDQYLKFTGGGIHFWHFNWYNQPNSEVQFRNLNGDDFCVIKAKQYNDICDDRVKINEKLIENATETLMKLRPQTYEQYGNMDCSGVAQSRAGLIAQEVYYQAPELRDYVMGYPSDISVNMIQDIDINSYDIQNDPDYEALGWGKTQASLSLNRFIPYLIRSNQEQETKIVALESENTNLKTQITDILQRLSNANI